MSTIHANAEVILVRRDGALILQQRDDKPGITNPGMVASFGGHIEANEKPVDAAIREINEETNLSLKKSDLKFFGKYRKTKQIHGEDWDVYYYVANDVDDRALKVYEGQGYKIIKSLKDLDKLDTSVLIREVLEDYFRGQNANLGD